MASGDEGRGPFVTKDGSTVKELIHPRHDGPGCMSIAEATVAPGEATSPHAHRSSEGIYNILEGLGTMWLDGRCNGVVEGDSIRIRQGARHHIVNDGDGPLRFLCCCSPPYSDEDTVMG